MRLASRIESSFMTVPRRRPALRLMSGAAAALLGLLVAQGHAQETEPQQAQRSDSTRFSGVSDPGFRPFPKDGEELTVIENRHAATNIDITAIRNRIHLLTQELNDLKLLRSLQASKSYSGNIEDRTPDSIDLTARVIGLKEMPLPDMEPKEGQVIFWNGSGWELQTPPDYIITGPKGTVLN